MASKTNIALKSFTIDSFAGIDKASQLVLVFPEGQHITKFEGNQGAGKTSALNALLYTMAQNIMVDPVNAKDLTTKTELEFVGKDGGHYRIRGQRTRLILEQKINDRWTEEKTPQSLIRKLIGYVGQDPMVLKHKTGAEQIEWIKNMFSLSVDDLAFQDELKKKLKKSMDERKLLNRQIKANKARLAAEPMYKNYEQNFALYTAPLEPSVDKQQRVDDLSKVKNNYSVAISRQNDITQSIADIDQQISDLEARVKSLREKRTQEEERLAAANKWIEENKSIDEDYQKAYKDLQAVNEKFMLRKSFEQVRSLHEATEGLESDAQLLTNKVDEYRKLQKDFIRQITPNVPGFEVCVPFEIDPNEEYDQAKAEHPDWTEEQLAAHVKALNGETREGIYYKGKTVLQLSESELWECYMKFCKELGICVVMVENLNSLGSSAVSVLNEIASAGVYVFASEMNRSEEHIRVSFTDKI